jgi:hypothetical protein
VADNSGTAPYIAGGEMAKMARRTLNSIDQRNIMPSVMKARPFLLVAGLLCATTGFAQGTLNIDYTWHGNSGYFAASFQIPPGENQPGQYFEDGTFESTFTVVSPDASYPSAGGVFSGADASGFGPPLQLSVTMTDPGLGIAVSVNSYNNFSFITEYRQSDDSILWRESGYWTSASAPEPSTLWLLILPITFLTARRLRHSIKANQ